MGRELGEIACRIQSAMRECRDDTDRQMSDVDYCDGCPLLKPCVDQKRLEKI